MERSHASLGGTMKEEIEERLEYFQKYSRSALIKQCQIYLRTNNHNDKCRHTLIGLIMVYEFNEYRIFKNETACRYILQNVFKTNKQPFWVSS